MTHKKRIVRTSGGSLAPAGEALSVSDGVIAMV